MGWTPKRFALCLIAFLPFTAEAAAPMGQWWDTGSYPPEYKHRKKITVTAGSPVSVGHSVVFTDNTASLISSSLLRADGKDWRIAWWNSGSSTWVELDRHVQYGTWNTSTTKTWFKLKAAIAASGSDDNYYVYYDYSSESTNPPQDLTNVYNPPKDASTEVLWYAKDGTGTTLTDWSGNGNDATLPSGWGWSSSSKFGTGFTTPNETSDKVIGSGFTANVDTGDWTVEMWLNITDNDFGTDTNDAMFWHTYRWEGFTQGINWATNTQMWAEINNGACRCDTTTTFTPGTTYHLAVTYQASTDQLRLYRNGTLVNTSPARVALSAAQINYGSDGSGDRTLGAIQEGLRVSNVRRTSFPYVVANEPTTSLGDPTAVDLVSFSAEAWDGSVELTWETASELDNLGFHLYRSTAAAGPYTRITQAAIPGLGSSPQGARYRFTDGGLSNGTTYYYKLEDIETTGKTKMHGPVSATPVAGRLPPSPPPDGIAFGKPDTASLKVLRQNADEVVLELETVGFSAEPLADGSVRLSVPGFILDPKPGAPEIPRFRSFIPIPRGRRVRVADIDAADVEVFASLRPSVASALDVVSSREGAVRLSARPTAASLPRGLYPRRVASILSEAYQQETRKALVELSPLRWDGARGLVLARKLIVRLAFEGRERAAAARTRTDADRRLRVRDRGLHAVRFEELYPGRREAIPSSSLRLSHQGVPVTFHVEPRASLFGPGSTLFFFSEGRTLNPYGDSAVYELERAAGSEMAVVSGRPSGSGNSYYWQEIAKEENRYYQAGLLEAQDLWLWDLLFAPVTKAYPFQVRGLASTSESASIRVFLQGVSDLEGPDHHVRLYVNDALVAESHFGGKTPSVLESDLFPGLLKEGDNEIQIENVGDTGAPYSMVMLDRFVVSYPRLLRAESGTLEGGFTESGVAEVAGLASDAWVLDVTDDAPLWVEGAEAGASGLRFRAEAGRRYLAVKRDAVSKPAIERRAASRLSSQLTHADYLVIGPRDLLPAAEPLLTLRRRQGLASRSVPLDEIFSQFGYGEPRPEAIRSFLSYAYHNWRKPAPRYVLLLGDASYDFQDFLKTGVKNQVPPLMVKTSYLWTASDPAYASVNGEDLLPDYAIGRLPAASFEEAQAMVAKILAYEGTGSLSLGPVILVADDADAAGDFPAAAEELAQSVLAARRPERVYLGTLGYEATRAAIMSTFDRGASLVSYIGHGGIHLWANENLFNTADVPALEPQSQQPIVLTMNCLNGYFHFPYFDSLGEALVKAKDKGAIAALSPSGLSLNEPAAVYHRAVLEALTSGRYRTLGDAVLAAQDAYAASGAFPELLSIYNLLGDPTLRLK